MTVPRAAPVTRTMVDARPSAPPALALRWAHRNGPTLPAGGAILLPGSANDPARAAVTRSGA